MKRAVIIGVALAVFQVASIVRVSLCLRAPAKGQAGKT